MRGDLVDRRADIIALGCVLYEMLAGRRRFSGVHGRWSQDADDKDAYRALGDEFDLARALIEARITAGLSQSQLARRLKTSQSCIARVEGGTVRPSTDALERVARATRTRLRIVFESDPAR